MLIKANIDIPETLSIFRAEGLQVSFIVPTETGLKKSIMDATESFREFLFNTGIHNYDKQNQGTANKKIVETVLISKDNFFQTKTSLYRPETKNGDPRIWVYELSKHASQGDLLAFLSAKDKLIVINCSNCNLQGLIKTIKLRIPNILSFEISSVSDELLSKLKKISNRGFIKSMRTGDTGVGFTLETLLGIPANSSKNPDYKGIEIKSIRQRNPKGVFFSMAPNWNKSNLSDKELIEKRGYYTEKFGPLKSLHQTLSTKKNKRNLKLLLEEQDIYGGVEINNVFEKDVFWSLEELQRRITRKHKETFWIDVETKGSGINEEFKYRAITHTSDVDVGVVPILLENEMITLDYILWEKGENWKSYTKKSGYDYLWKIKKKNLDALFKFIKFYDL
tara:strand:- start:3084 stop:4262 length:1179 start_codon:yes stop_codon:yes gene_type:complete